ncbi:uncharacterized protein BCR38DRAFT_506287 [Pseudomassariella vexata]|uniref:Uncharacterized protein n=1 Tax=Pseudomassariella vexata TaxID=1141098 RepID=A0A1Y2D7T9_9PEZI|nr:uncharacterized protein BCR38DRAFT_506287 [Pseudomassariella vexata]ORY55277.1 hypothetical protein BCR38DRAFT_506287 [Pseudomassariella vexata]
MMGGKIYEVGFLFARAGSLDHMSMPMDIMQLRLPYKERERERCVNMIVPKKEHEVIKHALDCLPWTSMGWSIHWGMRDILLAYAKPVLDSYRGQLAALLKKTVRDKPYLMDKRGWDPQFVRHNMGDMAASAVLAGEGNSGDLVRIVTDIARALVEDWDMAQIDEVYFWRRPDLKRQLDIAGVIALIKVFVVEWSTEFDYQMYHDLPMSLC